MAGNPPVRVLVVTRASRVWGAQLRLLLTAPELRARGVELTLAAPPGNAFVERWVGAGHALLALPAPGRDELRRADGRRAGPLALAGVAVDTVRRTVRLARLARRFDVLLSFNRHAHVEVVLAGRLARRPVVMEVVDIVRPGLGRRLQAIAASLATEVVANSRATASTLGGAADRTHVIHPGVDDSRFSPGPADSALRERLSGGRRGRIVAILGRVDPGKGIELLADAWTLADGSGRHPHLADAVLAVVGDRGVAPDGYVESLRSSVTARLGDRAVFTGRIEDVPAVLRTVDVVVNASDAEPFGRSVLEAQAVGVPVVAADGGGIPEFVADGVTGFLFPPGDVAGLADALERALADPAAAGAVAGAAQRQALERHATADRYDELAELYRRLAR